MLIVKVIQSFVPCLRQINKKTVHEILDLSVAGDRSSLAFDIFMICLIVANVVAIVLESEPSLHEIYHQFFYDFEVFSVAIFTVEMAMPLRSRLWAGYSGRSP